MSDVILIIFVLFVAFAFWNMGYCDCYIDFLKGKFKDEEPLIKLRGDDSEDS